jgi:hypothetical protein
MPVLDCPIPKEEWLHEISHRNGASQCSIEHAGRTNGAGRWRSAVAKITGLQDLDDDWDGAGAKAPSPDVVTSAIGLAFLLSEKGVDPPHRVAPGLEGEVIFEWQFPDGTYADIEVVNPLHAEVMVIEPGKPVKHWTLPTD